MKTKQELYSYLNKLSIATITYNHQPLYTVEQAKAVTNHLPGGHCKNLFLADNNNQLWLITAIDNTKIDLKVLSKTINAPQLKFASSDLLKKYLGVEPGSVTPLGLINDLSQDIKVILDLHLFDYEIINLHPLENNETIALNPKNLKKFIDACSNDLFIYDFQENMLRDNLF